MRTPLATSLAALALVLGAAACGGNGEDAAAPETATAPATGGEETTAPAETETTTATETVPEEVVCSATDHGVTLPKQDLPPAVADVRERIFAAASACDYDGLEKIALEKGEGFTYGPEQQRTPGKYWRNLETQALGDPTYVLAVLMTLPFTRNESGGYVWPSAANEKPTEEDWQALLDAFLYAPDEVRRMRQAGTGYTGWRTAITTDGDWQLFVERG
jgi:hypothetical protein